jgi:predicted nucleic acid-binding protein
VALVYFDSSALVKLAVEEVGSDVASALWDGCDAALSSRLAYPEVCAALAAAHRYHDLDDRGYAVALRE